MCKECGCGQGGEVNIGGAPEASTPAPYAGSHDQPASGAHHEHHDHDYPAGHDHSHPHTHDAVSSSPGEAGQLPAAKTVAVRQSLLEKNDRLAERNRGFFQAKRLLVLNMLSSPGSGKTTLLQKTAEALKGHLRLGAIVGDLATDNDAARLRAAGMPVVQITTGTVCHLEAEMVARAMTRLDLDALDILAIENVGNLVCPAAYDLGEHLRVVLLSVTEGEDKPLKYPPVFHSANVVIVTKGDLAEACSFDRAKTLANLHRVSHHATLFELSARATPSLKPWCDFLVGERDKLLRK